MFVFSFLENIPSYHTDHSKSQAEGNGLKEAEQGAEAIVTITTRDSKISFIKKTENPGL